MNHALCGKISIVLQRERSFQNMTRSKKSNTSSRIRTRDSRTKGRFNVGVIAAASLPVGGLAAAWWYRKTLKTLRQTEETGQNTHLWIKRNNPL
jgi:hypothetical protein